MSRAHFLRIFIKDIIDFAIVFAATLVATLIIYFLLPSFTRVQLSFFFFEQNFEIFFLNPKLVLWFFGLAWGVSTIYFLFCTMLHQSTVGGRLMGLVLVDNRTMSTITTSQALRMATGAYVGVVAFFVGPLYAWWLDDDTRGPAEKLSGTRLMKKSA